MAQKPTSDEAKRAAGTYRPSTAREPMRVPLGAPAAPEWLSKEARAQWEYVVSDLVASGAMARIDQTMLAMYAVLSAELAADPRAISAAKLTQLRLICAELGMTPVARLRIKAPEPDPVPPPPRGGNVVSISKLLKTDPKEPTP